MPIFSLLSQRLAALCVSLHFSLVMAEPNLDAQLDGKPLALAWQPLDSPAAQGQRFTAELQLAPGTLRLGLGDGDGEALKPFQRFDLSPASRFDFAVAEAGRYRLLVETGADAHLRLLPLRSGIAAK